MVIIHLLTVDYISTPDEIPDLLRYWRTGADFLKFATSLARNKAIRLGIFKVDSFRILYATAIPVRMKFVTAFGNPNNFLLCDVDIEHLA